MRSFLNRKKCFLTLLLLLVSFSKGLSQVFYDSPISVIRNALDYPVDLELGDLDGDGFLDIIVADLGKDGIFWLKNLGQNSFGEPIQITSSAVGITDIEVCDLNQDGNLDIVSSSFDDSKIAWYENLGLGAFQVQQIIGYVTEPRSVTIGDINNDGWIDVYATAGSVSFSGNTAKVWEIRNLGNGSFGLPQNDYGAINENARLKIQDLNNDGWNDLLRYGGSRISLVMNNGSGELEGPYIDISSYGDKLALDVGDLDSDGLTDIVTVYDPIGEDNTLVWFQNTGSNIQYELYEEHIITTIGSDWPIQSVNLALEDLNSNGLLDIVITGINGESIGWIENLGGGTFSEPIFISIGKDFSNRLAIADINNNGLPDIVNLSSIDKSLGSFVANDQVSFEKIPILSGFLTSPKLVTSDVNGDGLLDLVGCNRHLFWHEKNENNSLNPMQIIATFDHATRFEMADLNLDGTEDFIVEDNGSLHVVYNENGVFTIPQLIHEYSYLKDFSLQDLNGDGYPDLVSSADNAFCWLPNNQSGGFEECIVLVDDTYIDQFRFTDIDENGKTDIVLFDSGEIFILKQLDNGQFEKIPVHQYESANAWGWLGIGDFNGDGLIDIFSEETASDEVWVFKNEGNFVFGQMITPFTESEDTGIRRLIDFNSDGQLDYLEITNAVTVHLRNNALNDYTPVSLHPELFGNLLNLLDYDGDGDLDFLGGTSTEILLFEYRSTLTESSFTILTEECWQDTTALMNHTLVNFNQCEVSWDFGDGNTSNEVHPVHLYDTGGSYQIVLEVCCEEQCFIETQSVMIRKIDLIVPTTAEVGVEVAFENNSVGFTNQSWIFGDGNVSLESHPTHIYEEPGMYTVELFLTDSTLFDCTFKQEQTIIVEGGSYSDTIKNSSLRLFPNPVSSSGRLRLEPSTFVEQYEIFKLNGKLEEVNNCKQVLEEIDISNLNSGAYFIRLSSEQETYNKRFIVLD